MKKCFGCGDDFRSRCGESGSALRRGGHGWDVTVRGKARERRFAQLEPPQVTVSGKLYVDVSSCGCFDDSEPARHARGRCSQRDCELPQKYVLGGSSAALRSSDFLPGRAELIKLPGADPSCYFTLIAILQG